MKEIIQFFCGHAEPGLLLIGMPMKRIAPT
ncbi:hypothetical protein B7760_05958 (plasmid) [Burkholderia glumae]|nr:hypothetical protein B7760_05958 [Burkholderia glumae]QKM57538.1 hypothetical protein CG017_05617 [Burkholderia glumae]QTP37149.1 hypothetical protein B7759_05791 [Burkholderia glumae]